MNGLTAPIPDGFRELYAASKGKDQPFSLTAGRDLDTGLFEDARLSFSHLLPGRPALAERPAGKAGPLNPSADAIVKLRDAPITIRYRLTTVAPPAEARGFAGAELVARSEADRLTAWRAVPPAPTAFGTDRLVELADPSWFALWGADAAAVASYEVALPQGTAPDKEGGGASLDSPPLREDLFVLVREEQVYVITWTYPSAFVDDPVFASFASVAEATMVWDPARWEQHGRVWPDSALVSPGIDTQAARRFDDLQRRVATIRSSAEERDQLLFVLGRIVSSVGAPWVVLGPEALEENRRAILAAARTRELQAILGASFPEIRTAHELRGFAVLVGQALARPTAAATLGR